MDFRTIQSQRKIYAPFLERMQALCSEMDRQYDSAAGAYKFLCTGCDDNCCRTLFYHHTLIELLYLAEGFSRLEPRRQAAIRKAAAASVITGTEDSAGKAGAMCPVNSNGLCGLYANRPMICRLHGIPHELRLPNGKRMHGKGCDHFLSRFGDRPYIPFDRTPIYASLAALEGELRKDLDFNEKLKMTVAEAIVVFPEPKD